MYVYNCLYISIYMYIHLCIYIYIYIWVVCVPAYIYIYIYICIYIYIYMYIMHESTSRQYIYRCFYAVSRRMSIQTVHILLLSQWTSLLLHWINMQTTTDTIVFAMNVIAFTIAGHIGTTRTIATTTNIAVFPKNVFPIPVWRPRIIPRIVPRIISYAGQSAAHNTETRVFL